MRPLKHYLNRALKEKWAVPQFNFANIETLKAIISIAKKLRSPVIIGTSEGESGFLGLERAVALVRSFNKEGFPIFLNLDHGRSFEYCKEAIDKGYDTCHFDGSKLELQKNIQIAKKVVAYAHKKKVSVEGEVGFVGTQFQKRDLTDPDEALFFLRKTKVDRLAINVGTFHGIDPHGRKIRVNLDHLKKIKHKVGKIPLVLHGGSGVSSQDIKKAIKIGVAKINVNTELRIAFTKTLKEVLLTTKEVASYKYMPEVIEAVEGVVEEKIRLFGSANKI